MHTRSILTEMAALALLTASAAAAEPEVVKRWEFKGPENATGWTIGNHLRDLRVAEGNLSMEITGPDAFLFAPPIQAPLDGLLVRIRLRADRAGNTEIYWTTQDEPQYSARCQTSLFTPPAELDGSFVTVELGIGSAADAGRTLTGLRIDPYNRNTAGHVEIASVELLRLPPVFEANLAPAACRVNPDEPVTVRATCRQRAGRFAGDSFEVTIGDEPPQSATAKAMAQQGLTQQVRFDQPGVHAVRAVIRLQTGKPVFDLETTLVVGGGATLPTLPGLRTDRLRLDFVPTPDGQHVGAARWQVAGDDGAFRQAGWLLPLTQITVEDDQGRVVRRAPAFAVAESSPREVRLAGRVECGGTWEIEVLFQAAVKEGIPFISVVGSLVGPEGGRLLDFAGPVLRADHDAATDPLDRFAIFGGMEFLEPGWRSSSDRAVGPKFADRWSPHPYKITLPVMAVEANGLTTAMMWQPLEPWDGREAMPTATFASPNFLDGQDNHLMRLSVPSIPQWRAENESLARTPYVMKPGRPLSLRCALLGLFDTPAALTARAWYQFYGAPVPPPAPHDDRTIYNLYARHLGETIYWPAEKGWRHHWYLGNSSSFTPWIAAELVTHAIVTGDKHWVEATGLTGKTIIDTAGPLAGRVADAGPADAAIRSMRPDGTWAYVNTPEIRKQAREFTGGQFDSLGEDGSTSLGTCVVNALPILRYALLTGQDNYVQASREALHAMMQFRVPRGASVWEIHKDIPDLRAAGLAVEAYQLGYRITGDRRWLHEAGYWAWTGVPFLYSWPAPIDRKPGYFLATRDRNASYGQASPIPFQEAFENPHRRVTPYGSIPEFGPTFYVNGWFGVIVQWCGLEWADKVIELDRDRPEPLLRAIAGGVVASGLQQTFDRQPWVGLYPDVWDTQTNVAQGALICGLLPIQCLQAQKRLPSWTRIWTQVLRDPQDGHRWHISGWGEPLPLTWPTAGNPLRVPLNYPPGQPNELLIVGPAKPRLVRIDDQVLDLSDPQKVGPASAGWRYDPGLRAILIRFVQPQGGTLVRIEW